jgi:uncharacterized membrane protein
MIEDRMEEGLTEEEAVAAVGNVDDIAAQLTSEIPRKAAPAKQKKSETSGLTITLLILGFPLWFSLLVSAFAVVVSLYATLWALIISLWATFGAAAGCSLGGLVAGVIYAVGMNPTPGIALLGCSIACAGVSILLFLGCKAATKGAAILTKNSFLFICKSFSRKERSA